jgi:RimJ/RimL family protein N-acetyltransferase
LLESFLVHYRDSSMFLRANSRRAGLVDHGQMWQATYVGAFRARHLIGVAAHCWNGLVLIQAPDDGLAEAVRACVALSGREVGGFSGPLEQVQEARAALGLEHAPTRLDEVEGLYALDLSRLMLPEPLTRGRVSWRAPRPAERQTLRDWRVEYDVEALGSTPSEETRRHATEFLEQQLTDGNVWVAVEGDEPVSLSAFNAALPDIVQLGGIYTPPALRGRGYCKVAVAGSLIAAQQRGVTRAVLFTKNPSAVRSYEAVGFRLISDYALVFLAK